MHECASSTLFIGLKKDTKKNENKKLTEIITRTAEQVNISTDLSFFSIVHKLLNSSFFLFQWKSYILFLYSFLSNFLDEKAEALVKILFSWT